MRAPPDPHLRYLLEGPAAPAKDEEDGPPLDKVR